MTTGNRIVPVLSPVMARNNEFAEGNRMIFRSSGVFAVNIISSPGAGKTSLLEAMAARLGDDMVVIEGDVQTRRDAERIEKAGCTAWQIETEGACHLDAEVVQNAIDELDLMSGKWKILAIENVGNLICPSSYDLGEHMKIALLSLPEGDDKILKYPAIFSRISILVVSKMDLQSHMDFDVERAEQECRSLNPDVKIFRLSSSTGEGITELCNFLLEEREKTLSAAI
jgi:hydrogenase nickel incorporation protein HypB